VLSYITEREDDLSGFFLKAIWHNLLEYITPCGCGSYINFRASKYVRKKPVSLDNQPLFKDIMEYQKSGLKNISLITKSNLKN
jgi:hypothetical protein